MKPDAYIDTCLYLYCSLLPKEREGAVCDTLASYARECAQQHIILTWRTASLCGKEINCAFPNSSSEIRFFNSAFSNFCLSFFQAVFAPEARSFQTVCPRVPPAVLLRSPQRPLQPLACAERSVSGAVSVLRGCTFTRASA